MHRISFSLGSATTLKTVLRLVGLTLVTPIWALEQREVAQNSLLLLIWRSIDRHFCMIHTHTRIMHLLFAMDVSIFNFRRTFKKTHWQQNKYKVGVVGQTNKHTHAETHTHSDVQVRLCRNACVQVGVYIFNGSSTVELCRTSLGTILGMVSDFVGFVFVRCDSVAGVGGAERNVSSAS